MGHFFSRIAWTIIIPLLLAGNILTLTWRPATAAVAHWLDEAGVGTVYVDMEQKRREQDLQLATALARSDAIGERIQAVGSAIRQRTFQSASASVGSLPAGAVPYLGWAVVVGVTGYELMLACENLRDINDLYADFGVDSGGDDASMAFICDPDLRSFAEAYERIPDALAAEYATFQAWAEATESALPGVTVPGE